ncbi:MAG: FHA domain-containing protein [Acidimicrobiia bacterium]|nr:FHA domain-containing protein [Acidimicrobiia bacterium]
MTDLDLRSGQIHRGLGVVARWPDIALVIPSDAAHDGIVDDMFLSLGANPTSQDIIRAVNALLSDNKLRSVAMIVEATGGPMAVAFGPVEILSDGELVIGGANGLQKQQLSHSAQRLTLRAANLTKAAEPVPPFDLRRGVAPGAGLSLVTIAGGQPPALDDLAPLGATADNTGDLVNPVAKRSGEPSEGEVAEYEPASTDDGGLGSDPSQAPFRSVILIGTAAPSHRDPLPIVSGGEAGGDGPIPASPTAQKGRIEVDGILCSRGHFNNPKSAYCMVCGMSLLHLTPHPVVRPRPTLGFIVFDDGASFGLDRSYVIGREPSLGDNPDAELLVIHDNNDTLSRTHAELRLDGWTVQIVDLGSTNGTYVWDSQNDRWNQLTAGHPIELQSGETVALGRRTFVFESVSRT